MASPSFNFAKDLIKHNLVCTFSILRTDIYLYCMNFFRVKGAVSRNVNKRLSKLRFRGILRGYVTEICHYFSQNEGVVLKMDS